MLDEIDYKDIKKYKKYITTDINNNSYLYFDKEIIHKILFCPSSNLEDVLKMLDELKLEELIEIKNLIYNEGNLVGYSIKNYKEYKSLKKLKSRNFDLKKQDCIKLVSAYNNILTKGLSYRDFHLGNILLNPKNNDIKICDLDSFIPFQSWQSEECALESLLTCVLEYLYDVEYMHIVNYIYLYKIMLNSFEKNISIEYILKRISLIDSESVKKDRKEIINKSGEVLKYK